MDINFQIQYDGATPQVYIEKLSQELNSRLPKALASRFKEQVEDNIDNNKYGFKLSEAWIAVKEARGWQTQPFVAEGFYKSMIKTDCGNGYFTVGFEDGAKHPRSGKDMVMLANMLEFGSADQKVPARPLWRMSADDFIAGLGDTLVEEMEKFDLEKII
jgi:hypothetical protein